MGEAVAIAEAWGATLVFEPEVNNVVDSAQKARRLLDEVRSEHLQVVTMGPTCSTLVSYRGCARF